MSTPAARSRRAALLTACMGKGDRAAVALCLGFVALTAPVLSSLQRNFDEGVTIQQAKLVMNGLIPYRDFFCHQTPLHLFTLAGVAWPAPDWLFPYRLPSLLATALGGFLVYRIALELTSKPAAWAAGLLSLVTTVQFYGLVTLPNSLMLVCSTGAVWLGFFRRGRRTAALAGVLLALSVLYKPLSVATGAALVLAMLIDRDRRRDLPLFLLAGAATGLLAFAAFDILSEGGFRELLRLQLTRYARSSGFESMQTLGPWRETIEARGVESAFGWNWDVHVQALALFRNWHTTGWVVLLALLGVVTVLFSRDARVQRARLLLLLWWAVPLAACLWLWEPIWDHYLMQYVPPMAILGALLLHRIHANALARPLIAILLVALTGVAITHLAHRRPPRVIPLYASLTNQRWLTFDPFIHFLARTDAACGLIDPFNVYGPHSLTAPRSGEPPPRFHVDSEMLIRCLEEDPQIRIGIGYWGRFFVDDTLLAYFAEQPDERFLPASLYGPDDPQRPKPAGR